MIILLHEILFSVNLHKTLGIFKLFQLTLQPSPVKTQLNYSERMIKNLSTEGTG